MTPTDIADELWRTRKIRVDRRKIEIDTIKRIGRYAVPIELFQDVRVEVKTLVVPEGGELPSDEELAAMEAEERAEEQQAEAPGDEPSELEAVLAAEEEEVVEEREPAAEDELEPAAEAEPAAETEPETEPAEELPPPAEAGEGRGRELRPSSRRPKTPRNAPPLRTSSCAQTFRKSGPSASTSSPAESSSFAAALPISPTSHASSKARLGRADARNPSKPRAFKCRNRHAREARLSGLPGGKCEALSTARAQAGEIARNFPLVAAFASTASSASSANIRSLMAAQKAIVLVGPVQLCTAVAVLPQEVSTPA